jgi:putative peptidoglycan lipid II flippase
MPTDLLKKSLNLLLRRQTNILTAAYVIMATIVLSQILGLIRERVLVSIFGPTNTLGIYNYATTLPNAIFQLTIASAFAVAFIPVFSDYITKNKEDDAYKLGSTLLVLSMGIFLIFSVILGIFAPFALSMFNLGSNFSPDQIDLMANLMRIALIGQLLFIIGTFYTALLQSYNHFFIPGIAAALYNFGTIVGILLFHSFFGIYAAPLGLVFGGIIFVLFQIPTARKMGFRFMPSREYVRSEGMKKVFHLMLPNTIQRGISEFGTVALAIIIGFMVDPGRMKLLFDYAKTLMFAPVSLFGYSIAQAAFPVLARERNNLQEFKATFLGSFNQMLYLILPISALILVLRIPIVRLIYGADKFDWPATVLTGRTLAFLAISIFAQALIVLFYRGFYALHNSVIPFVISAISTVLLIIFSFIFVVSYNLGIESIAVAFSLARFFELLVLFYFLDKKTGGFNKKEILISLTKYFVATVSTAFALYIPIKLLDQLVFDTTRTVNLIILTGISSFAGLVLYLFLTWLLDINEARAYILMCKKLGNWREIMRKIEELIGQQ